MTDFNEQITLGSSGLTVGRLGVSGGYGAPAAAFEKAFERGCNYFYHGSRRRPGMNEAIRNIISAGKRDELIIVAQIYTRSKIHFNYSLKRFLKTTGIDSFDVLLLGWYNSVPSQKILDACAAHQERGVFKHIAISGHNRDAFPLMADRGLFDIFHMRYNAAHRGSEPIFEKLRQRENHPGVVIYTATRWGQFLNPKKMPAGVETPRASDCYRYALSNPSIDLCMTGPKTISEMDEALATLDRGPLDSDEMAMMIKIGDHLHG